MNTLQFDDLIQGVDEYSQDRTPVTFLEICHYSGRRFEEISSRILKFYLNPNNPHGLNDVLIKTFLKLLDTEFQDHPIGELNVETEVYANGKYLDVVAWNDEIVLGIENKILATLYNPLGEYSKKIESYKSPVKYKVVLSLRKLEINEKAKADKYEFVEINYLELFEAFESQIENLEIDKRNPHLVYFNDFILTLRNMTKRQVIGSDLDKFIYQNDKRISKLMSLYLDNQKMIQFQQSLRISDIKIAIERELKTENWWIWSTYVLGYSQFNSEKKDIGIEGYFLRDEMSSTAKFVIGVITWSKNSWSNYEQLLAEKYENLTSIKSQHGNHTKCNLEILNDNPSDIEIVKRMKFHFDKMSSIDFGKKK